ncbi:MAG: excinuclease ABC subunit UvrC [Chloroflexi bacterium]|nr:excinuclease ABC subunit UvrC [Chloroflexota bacterium]
MPYIDFSERLKATPTKPGVYLMRDEIGAVLYVGKAAGLRSRVSSYFAPSASHPRKIANMVERVADFEYIVTESEQEALILECNLIKEHQPPYNARLKDDKSYPFIKIDVSEDFPQVYITRRVNKDGSKYFGPFASAGSVRRTLGLLKKLFPYRSCTKTITGTDARPCLDYHIHRCVGPCIGAVDKQEYGEVIDQVILFLEGKTNKVVGSIKQRMLAAAESLEFEKAAVLRDQLTAIEKVHEGQKVLHLTSENADVIATAPGTREAWVEVFFIRQGKLIGRDNFLMTGTQDDEPNKILTAFVKQFYDATPYVPPRILVQHPLEETDGIVKWLREKRQGSVRVHVPQRGEKRRLVQMVAENAEQGFEQLRVKQMSDTAAMDAAMSELQEALSLPSPPRRIECYDISNIQGTNAVGSMVVFEDGKPKKAHYRRFQIKSVKGVDDYSMMRETLTRRFKRLSKSRRPRNPDDPPDKPLQPISKADGGNAWGIEPDLVLIDGGKGHLGAALQVLLELGINDIPLASLAKENEELFIPMMSEGIMLPRNSQGLYLVQRARDEAHRFAITFHRERRSKKSVQSALDLVPGIGPKRKRMLIRRFGSVRGVSNASVEEIASVPGMTLTLARSIKNYV